MSDSDPGREERLRALCGAIELVLPDPWIYFCVISQPGRPELTNLVSNASEAFVIEIIEEIKRRVEVGEKPKEL